MNQAQSKTKYFIHESSYVDEPSEIGEGSELWHFSHIMRNAKIGHNCRLGQNVFIGEDVSIGNSVKIQNNVSVYTGVTIEDEVFCGPSVVFTNVKYPRAGYPVTSKSDYKGTVVKRGSTIGANATIICGNTIGKYSFISAGSVVADDIPDYAIFMGVPAKFYGWICECGTKLESGSGDLSCSKCYKKFFLKNDLLERVK